MDERTARGIDDRGRPVEGRRDGIDFWRGFILCTIFVNHVPGTLFERLTFRNYGFSDSSEAFVFISGVSLALAYGRRIAAGVDGRIVASLARRGVKLYAIHIALSLAGLAVFALGAALAENPDLMQVHGRDLMVDDPSAAVVGLVSLGHQFGYFNILPLYVVLVGMAPALFWLARISRPLMLAASFGLYAASRLSGLNIPTWPMRGEWFFDPFAWQLLLAIGLAVGLQLRSGLGVDRRLAAGAAAVVAGAAFCATDGFSAWPGLGAATRVVADLDKTTLGLGRIAHFLSLAYCLHALGATRLMRHAFWYAPLCLVGRNGLLMFALVSLLAAAGQVAVEAFGHTALVDTMVVVGGIAAIVGAAGRVARHRTEIEAAAVVARR